MKSINLNFMINGVNERKIEECPYLILYIKNNELRLFDVYETKERANQINDIWVNGLVVRNPYCRINEEEEQSHLSFYET